MSRCEEMERRLLNWARWKQGAGVGGLGFAAVKLEACSSRPMYRESIIPTSAAEAEETDRGITWLSEPWQRTVRVHYLARHGLQWQSAQLGVSDRMIRIRIEQAHVQLKMWLHGVQLARLAQRDRVEALQRAARPGGR